MIAKNEDALYQSILKFYALMHRRLLTSDVVFFLRFVTQTNMEFAQLLFVHSRRSLRKQALSSLGLREGDNVTDRISTAHHCDNTVETEGQAAVRWGTELESFKQEAKFLASFLRTNFESLEDLFLNFFAVDTDRAAADFPTVEHHDHRVGW